MSSPAWTNWVSGVEIGVPATSGLVEMVNGVERRLPNDKFFVPGSVLSMDVDPANPLAYGFDPKVDVMWENSPALKLGPDAALKGVKTVGWFDTDYLGIDEGPILAMIENHRSELVWKTMRRNAHLIRGLRAAGFTGGWLDGASE